MKYITIASKDMFSDLKFNPETKRYSARRLIISEFSTIDEVEELKIDYWPEEVGQVTLPGYSVFKVAANGLLTLVKEAPIAKA